MRLSVNNTTNKISNKKEMINIYGRYFINYSIQLIRELQNTGKCMKKYYSMCVSIYFLNRSVIISE